MTKLIETVLVSGVWGLSVSSLVWGLELEGFTTVIQLAVAKLQNEVLKHEIEDYEEEDAYKIKKDEDK